MSESCCLLVCLPPVSCYSSCPHLLSLVSYIRMFPYKMFKMCVVTMGSDEGTHLNINLDPTQFPATSSLTLMGCDWVLHDWITSRRHSSMLMVFTVITASMVILNPASCEHPSLIPGETGDKWIRGCGVIINYPSLSKSAVREICWLSLLCWLAGCVSLYSLCPDVNRIYTSSYNFNTWDLENVQWESLGKMGKAVMGTLGRQGFHLKNPLTNL